MALLASAGHEVVGVDLFEFPDWELLRQLPQVQLESGVSAEALPFDDNSFDHASCISALLYFSEPTTALSEIARVLRPGGRLAVRTVNSGNLYTRRTKRPLDPAARNLYTLAELSALVEGSGFRVVERFGYGFWPPFATDLWWYLQSTAVPQSLQSWLSRLLPEGRRVNNVVLATT